MEFLLCETCVFANWVDGDPSVGMRSYIEECGKGTKTAYPHFDIIIYEENYEHDCPFYMEQFIPENELVICPKCESRDAGIMGTDLDNMTEMLSCNDCNYTFIHEIINW